MAEKGWIEIGRVVGDTEPKGDTEIQDLLEILDRPGRLGTLELLALVLLLKVHITLTRN